MMAEQPELLDTYTMNFERYQYIYFKLLYLEKCWKA